VRIHLLTFAVVWGAFHLVTTVPWALARRGNLPMWFPELPWLSSVLTYDVLRLLLYVGTIFTSKTESSGKDIPMPEVIIELAEGRTLDQKRRLVQEITDVVVRVCDVDAQAVVVIIHTNPKTDKAKGGVLFSDR
jgi:4-oxalocrotonate tautomerase